MFRCVLVVYKCAINVLSQQITSLDHALLARMTGSLKHLTRLTVAAKGAQQHSNEFSYITLEIDILLLSEESLYLISL